MGKNGPNKTVAAARRKMGGFPARPSKPVTDPFMLFLFDEARRGNRFETEEAARLAFEMRNKP